jgi:hypothetical protein
LVDNYYAKWYYVIPDGGRVMEKENVGPVGASQAARPTATGTGEEAVSNEPQKAVEGGAGPLNVWSPQPTVLTLQDLVDLPRQLLPEQTYIHLRNAGREAILAIVSLVSGFNNSRRGPEDGKIRRHIDVE